MPWAATVNNYILASTSTDLDGVAISRIDIDHPEGRADTALATGTGANQINLGWADTRTYDGTGVTLDLTALASAATNTGAATFTAVKLLKIRNDGATNDLTVGNAASVQFTPGFSAATTTVTIKPGQEVVFRNVTAAGWDCTTNKNLKIIAAASTTAATVIILGLD
jgi:hypothetical protein